MFINKRGHFVKNHFAINVSTLRLSFDHKQTKLYILSNPDRKVPKCIIIRHLSIFTKGFVNFSRLMSLECPLGVFIYIN